LIGEVFNTINHGGIFTYLLPIMFGAVLLSIWVWLDMKPEHKEAKKK